MDLAHPLRVVTPTVDGDVLAALARAETEFTPPQLAGLLEDWSVEGVRRCLKRLVDQGIVVDRAAGRARLYCLNRNHLAAPAIAALAELRDTLIDRLRHDLGEWETPCVYAALFGSAARGDMRADSDIDLFVVRSDSVDPDDEPWGEQLAALSRQTTARTGNDTRILEFSHEEVQTGLARDERVLVEIARDGLCLAGESSYLRPRRRH